MNTTNNIPPYLNLSLGDMDGEIWKDVVGYEGQYQVSSLGRVKSLKLYSQTHHRILRQSHTGNGYLTVKLNNRGIKNIRVHRLVAMHFIPNPKNLSEINHIDEDKNNNIVANLEWCDRKYNVRYGNRTEKVAQKNRNRADQSLPVAQIDENGNVIMQFPSIAEAGRYYNCRPSSIGRVCHGERRYYKKLLFKFI